MPAPWANSNRASRLPIGWAAIRKAVLNRDQRICYLCGGPGADTVDHIRPGDDHSMSNLAAVHDWAPPHCHRRKTQADAAVTRAKGRPPVRRHPGLKT